MGEFVGDRAEHVGRSGVHQGQDVVGPTGATGWSRPGPTLRVAGESSNGTEASNGRSLPPVGVPRGTGHRGSLLGLFGFFQSDAQQTVHVQEDDLLAVALDQSGLLEAAHDA